MLYVNELYGPVSQGEGKSTGMPCFFLRMAFCQLSCSWCDSPYTWNWHGTKHTHPDKYDRDKEVHQMDEFEVWGRLTPMMADHQVNALVISGGEPFLQQRGLAKLLKQLRRDHWHIEIETNGAVMPQKYFTDHLDQINCSPKLSNSGDPEHKRIKPDVLERFSAMDKTNFKFVISSEQDMVEVDYLVKRFGMKDVYLMPEGRTREELEKTSTMTRELALSRGWNFSARKHIEMFGNQRGV